MSAIASPARTSPKRFTALCTEQCRLNEQAIGAEGVAALLAIYERGTSVRGFARDASLALGRPVSEQNSKTHLKHYRELQDPANGGQVERRASDIEILDEVIQSAWQNRRAWKPSLRDMLEAMAKKHQITGGSEVSELLGLFDAPNADLDAEEDVFESESAILSPEERSEDADEDLDEG